MKEIKTNDEMIEYITRNGIKNLLLGGAFSESHPSLKGKNLREYLRTEEEPKDSEHLFNWYEKKFPYNCIEFLSIFHNIFSLNHDPLFNFELLKKYDLRQLSKSSPLETVDGFNTAGNWEKQEDIINNLKNADKKVMHLQGAHFIKINNNKELAKMTRASITPETIKQKHDEEKSFLIVKNEEKTNTIKENPYLEFCHTYFREELAAPLLIFGVDFLKNQYFDYFLGYIENNDKIKEVYITYQNSDEKGYLNTKIKQLFPNGKEFNFIKISSHNIIWKFNTNTKN